ncbi:hypothetical protein EDD16DRAFT_1620966 [Pisolithus croceorrhizus]|nr:hypothetical protein EDD16DRAFT_1620966 [Pisolithus croceorrhizus]
MFSRHLSLYRLILHPALHLTLSTDKVYQTLGSPRLARGANNPRVRRDSGCITASEAVCVRIKLRCVRRFRG